MKLSNYLLEGIYSAVYKLPSQFEISYGNVSRAEISDIIDFFLHTLKKEQNKIIRSFVKKYGNITHKDYMPKRDTFIIASDYASITMPRFSMYYTKDRCDYIGDYNLVPALINTLKKLKDEYPYIRYTGYIAEIWSDDNSGGINQYELDVNGDIIKDSDVSDSNIEKADNTYNEKRTIYEHVGSLLGPATEIRGFWDSLEQSFNFMNNIDLEYFIRDFFLYYEYIPTYEWTKLKGLILHYDFRNGTGYLFRVITMLSLIKRHRFIERSMLHKEITNGYLELIELVAFVARNTDYKCVDETELGSDDLQLYMDYAYKIAADGNATAADLIARYESKKTCS